MNTHRCAALKCTKIISTKLLMCLPHWRKVPYALRNAIWQEYRPGQENPGEMPSDAYVAAMRQAIQAVAEKEGTGFVSANVSRPPFSCPKHGTILKSASNPDSRWRFCTDCLKDYEFESDGTYLEKPPAPHLGHPMYKPRAIDDKEGFILQEMDECKHFGGLAMVGKRESGGHIADFACGEEPACAAGVVYGEVLGQSTRPPSYPCWKVDGVTERCSLASFYTREEAEQRFEERMQWYRDLVAEREAGICHECKQSARPMRRVGPCVYGACGHRQFQGTLRAEDARSD